jgi:hypothetical protein
MHKRTIDVHQEHFLDKASQDQILLKPKSNKKASGGPLLWLFSVLNSSQKQPYFKALSRICASFENRGERLKLIKTFHFARRNCSVTVMCVPKLIPRPHC